MTALMQQYHKIKERHKDAILLFHLGDFYEMFYEDARVGSQVLGIALTSRFKGEKAVPMAGIPVQAVEGYVARLLRAGLKVALCEQVQDAEEAKGLVERAVTRIITPGTLTEEATLDAGRNNFLAACLPGARRVGLAWADLSTGEFFVQHTDRDALLDELTRIAPAECLIPESMTEARDRLRTQLGSVGSGLLTPVPDWTFEKRSAVRALQEHFGVETLEGFGVGDMGASLGAAGAILEYLQETQRSELRHFTRLSRRDPDEHAVLDRATLLSLEILRPLRGEDPKECLLGVLDRTRTPMGARLLKDWLARPLRELGRIRRRQEAVAEWMENSLARRELQEALRRVYDLERITGKLGSGRANPRELVALRSTLLALPAIHRSLGEARVASLQQAAQSFPDLSGVAERLARALEDEVPVHARDGEVFRDGYHSELDEYRALLRDGTGWIARYQAQESKRAGIPSLKVGFNKVFGYYLEVTHTHRERIPGDYVRKQTLKNAERYITPQLKEHEAKVLQAGDRARELEVRLFGELRESLQANIPQFQQTARLLARLDAIAALAAAAEEGGYVMPEVCEEPILDIVDGRHPVLEKVRSEPFVPNDTRMSPESTRLLIVTGPNMAGKSTYIRQAALLTLMAQLGSAIPVRSARIGVADRFFARVGASDELTRGQSTFMVEMMESANILNNATARSLVVLDEIGRGTSTFDGLSIAWAVAEYLHDRLAARTLFATHYHELTELSKLLPAARNCHVSVKEWGDRVIFLHKLVDGGTDKSYGIHVARLAGVPKPVIHRARKILTLLEEQMLDSGDLPKFAGARARKRAGELAQLSLFSTEPAPAAAPKKSPLVEKLRELDPDNLTPLQALQRLREMKDEAEEGA